MQVETVELLSNLKEEDAENKHAHQQIKSDAELDHHGHSVRCAGCCKEQAVLHSQKSDDLRHCFATRDHHQEGQQDHAESDSDIVARDGRRQHGDWLRQTKSEDHQHQSRQHGGGNIDQRLVVPLRAKPDEQACAGSAAAR